MRPSYKVEQMDGRYGVIEVATGLCVIKHKHRADAIKLAVHLGRGSGFRNWTPQFMTNEFRVNRC